MRTRAVSDAVVVAAEPHEVFAVIADPSRHSEFDGSGTVRERFLGDSPLSAVGQTFGVQMRLGPIPYRMVNTVVEFERDRVIAWRHAGGHRWRYRLEPVDGGTRVTETFDWSTSRAPWMIEFVRYPMRNLRSIRVTLARLQTIAS